MTLVGIPVVVHTADDLLPLAQELVESETAALEADPDVVVSCGPKCNACCDHAVVVTASESRAIAIAVAMLPRAVQENITSRARQILNRVAVELNVDAADVGRSNPDFPKAYYAMQEPCPLLVNGSCSVRTVRPLVCREYLMSSAPQHCFDPTLEHVVPIRRGRGVSTRAPLRARSDVGQPSSTSKTRSDGLPITARSPTTAIGRCISLGCSRSTATTASSLV